MLSLADASDSFDQALEMSGDIKYDNLSIIKGTYRNKILLVLKKHPDKVSVP